LKCEKTHNGDNLRRKNIVPWRAILSPVSFLRYGAFDCNKFFIEKRKKCVTFQRAYAIIICVRMIKYEENSRGRK
jgi:hypothetical protein